ncbi:MAG: hypothetical protein A2Y03_05330 [Omnitrophica WOR_2 bacterium GWF2_38_59]|nr:MAG: hypothetical protein A2Y03_05330 [Omnitrophica WOR_2 bacterium GWF2_38_59]OGX51198.1 MAG: hypothetical protein A2243_05115 [Omnitrophica WOR_2 bacterium RIFOXYA2_FULL_38_17]OGX54611.1 MAG: hypothetical protein A2267_02075 [Omnitrophica WOR_2 bacterium RIFOXYA12_FULL_38_10]OGX55319.1 MAG: hypothetical protein A2306_06465 [Omnitrophica WOR_2 bacterium RIFOXYB2_FULL_38_16]OGX57908.1 MAG: hypothetical protein A2447_01890 [Omnitrophica WOR_2 bacterium RIFOXYC2_FULL_38_12]HBG60271.1 hypothet
MWILTRCKESKINSEAGRYNILEFENLLTIKPTKKIVDPKQKAFNILATYSRSLFNDPNKENVIGTSGGKYGKGTNIFDLLAIIIPLPARIFLEVHI